MESNGVPHSHSSGENFHRPSVRSHPMRIKPDHRFSSPFRKRIRHRSIHSSKHTSHWRTAKIIRASTSRSSRSFSIRMKNSRVQIPNSSPLSHWIVNLLSRMQRSLYQIVILPWFSASIFSIINSHVLKNPYHRPFLSLFFLILIRTQYRVNCYIVRRCSFFCMSELCRECIESDEPEVSPKYCTEWL